MRRDETTQCLDGVLRNLDAPVVVFDRGFNIRHIHCFAFTVGAFGVTTGTDEVRVDDATAALGVGDHEAGAALTAVHGAFEVVIVGLGFLARYLLRAEHCLVCFVKLMCAERALRSRPLQLCSRPFERRVFLVIS